MNNIGFSFYQLRLSGERRSQTWIWIIFQIDIVQTCHEILLKYNNNIDNKIGFLILFCEIWYLLIYLPTYTYFDGEHKCYSIIWLVNKWIESFKFSTWVCLRMQILVKDYLPIWWTNWWLMLIGGPGSPMLLVIY